ncbi:MAG: ABC transporter ATP-binding protein [Actinomycetaceae bacterium]|nr:ABC transporter ATP-binding protein [Actinomycetaceae bacterium]
MNSTRRIISWLVAVTRSTLPPLAGSLVCRVADHLLGVGLLAAGAWCVVTVAERAGASGSIDTRLLLAVVAAMALACLAKGVCHYGEQFLGHLVAFTALEQLRRHVFESLIPASPAIVATARSGDLLARLTADIDRIEVFYAHTIVPAISALVVPVLLFGATGWAVGWGPALIALGIVALVIAADLGLGRAIAVVSAGEALAARAKATHAVTDSLAGVREVIGYGMESQRLAQLAGHQRVLGRHTRRLAAVMAVRRAIGQAGMIACCFSPAGLALTAGYPPAVCAAVALAWWRGWEVVRGVEEFATSLMNSLAGARRVYEVVHASPAVVDGPGTLEASRGAEVRFRDVSFTYPAREGSAGTVPVLTGVDLVAGPGQWVALTGPTGAGKSTLVRLLLRYHDVTEGAITVAGTDIRDVSLDSLRSFLTCVQQRPHLFAGTVADNLRLQAPHASEDDMWDALEGAQLADELRAREGLATRVADRAQTLSGGQAQRLALARAYLARPRVLVLDEFTSHLDPELAERTRREVRRRLPDATIIEVTHTPDDLVGLADAVYRVEGGFVRRLGGYGR